MSEEVENLGKHCEATLALYKAKQNEKPFTFD